MYKNTQQMAVFTRDKKRSYQERQEQEQGNDEEQQFSKRLQKAHGKQLEKKLNDPGSKGNHDKMEW